ncbi:SpoIIIAH-like family protein [Clostridium tagluense]|uniref:SpoIIIAH-like family protein n=1 Tax=Clostridium TaxID=1485 RepID=UPI0013E94D1D|nr:MULTISPECIES: SpoIIIAH-like family protein [Clostridium]MBU3126573.1 SpoIIIAH-like family protein [Clostridium tagluense]MBW9156307.1 SpoIIIAH-like family protein [Clostridium tagluense]MBZ9624466.1 SpoIIIAH-like family protein [Clostridium sp. FP2]MCB2309941.1 SpoIIIAH-like family protein [Clostridium tagluense]MCB2314529.1 SpoIIIAH-like family protein [Clostridium tagluense]
MNKKQSGIIVTLVVLIICAGYLATKVNGPLYVNDSDFGEKSAISLKENKSSSTFFAEAKLSRNQESAKALQAIKLIIDDANTPKEEKKKAADEYLDVSTTTQKESDVELALKAKGFEEALCSIVDDKVEIFVKSSKKELSKEELRGIQDVVMSKTKLENIDVKVKE